MTVDMGQRRYDRQDIEINPPGHDFGDGFDWAAERDVLRREAGAQAKALGREVRGGADPGRGVIELARVGLGGGDEVAQRLPTLRGRRDQHGGLDAKRDDGDEIIEGIVRQALVERVTRTEA